MDATARDKHSQKRVKHPSGEERSGGARKAGKSNYSMMSRKAGKGWPKKAGPSRRMGTRRTPPWTKVERKKKKKKTKSQVAVARDAKPRRKRVGAKREKSDALIIKTEQSRYSDALKVMRSDAKLVHLGADVRSIRRTRTSCQQITAGILVQGAGFRY